MLQSSQAAIPRVQSQYPRWFLAGPRRALPIQWLVIGLCLVNDAYIFYKYLTSVACRKIGFMLFNSPEFIFVFLPAAWLVFFLSERFLTRELALISVIISSCWFYGTWNLAYLFVMIASVLLNYSAGWLVDRVSSDSTRRVIIFSSISLNIITLIYFKYLVYLLSILGLGGIVQSSGFFQNWALPLGISFWTFQQINFLLERYHRQKDNLNLLDYVSIVMFFPHLIAGPIVRTAELGPQVKELGTRKRDVFADLAVGLLLFIVGLFKKCCVADLLSVFPNTLYGMDATTLQSQAGPVFAWFGVITYMLQLYFDFSGYCDMGMGLARMFGFRFPINFNSPLQAIDFADFWRRWHITLTRFFTDTLHTPMTIKLMRQYGGGKWIALSELMIIALPVTLTFILTGIWHGAGNQFFIFGLVNGLLVSIVILWQSHFSLRIPKGISRILTFLTVCAVFVFFRAPSLEDALAVFKTMASWPSKGDFSLFKSLLSAQAGPHKLKLWILIIFGLGALFAPNIYQILAKVHQPLGLRISSDMTLSRWTCSLGWCSAMMATLASYCILYYLMIRSTASFIYFQF